MPDTLKLNENEKALFYVNYMVDRNTGAFLFGSIVVVILSLFKDIHQYEIIPLLLLIGGLFAYIDNKLSVYFLIHRPEFFALNFWKLAKSWPFNSFEPFASNIEDLKDSYLSTEMLGYNFFYVSCKSIIIIFSGITVFCLSVKRAEAIIFNIGLTYSFLGIFYLLLWYKKYYWIAAKKLGLVEDRSKEIKEFKRKEWGSV